MTSQSYHVPPGHLRRMSPVDPREAQYFREKELQVLDQMESRIAPVKESSTNQLDNKPLLDKLRQNATGGSQVERQRTELARTILDQIYLEKEIEKLKAELASRSDFTCPAAFREFDFCNREKLTKPQFAESLYSYIGHELYNRN